MTIVQQSAAWVKNTRNRRLTYLVLLVLSGLLIFFPRPYVATAKIVPQDTSAMASSTTSLLGALGGGPQSIGSLLTGGRPTNDLYLAIAKSETVADDVADILKMYGPGRPFPTLRKAKLSLAKHVDIHLLLGGVMQIEGKYYSQDEALRVTAAYSDAISSNLARFGKQIIQNKQRILKDRIQDATVRLQQAEADLNAFRRANNLAEPEAQLGAAMSRRAGLEAQLQAKQIELQTMQQFRGPESAELASVRSDIAALRRQIAQSTVPAAELAGPNVAGLTAIELRYLNIYRDLRFQQSIYDVYQKSAEQVAVEALVSESASYIQVIDPPLANPYRQYNNWAIAVFGALVLLALFTEWYGPATGLFGHRRPIEMTESGTVVSRRVSDERLEYAE